LATFDLQNSTNHSSPVSHGAQTHTMIFSRNCNATVCLVDTNAVVTDFQHQLITFLL
jgi:hypothetical protein